MGMIMVILIKLRSGSAASTDLVGIVVKKTAHRVLDSLLLGKDEDGDDGSLHYGEVAMGIWK